MNKVRVMTAVGTRPEIIRLSRVITVLDRECSQTLVHTGQNHDYELNQLFFDDLDIRKPDYFLEAAGETPCATVGNIIARMDTVLEAVRPEALLVLGDTNSCLAAYPAKRRKIPVFHMEAGNRCFDHRVPEEINRRLVDHIADVNLPYSGIAREYLLREGIPPDLIIKTGSPMYEVIQFYLPKIKKSDILGKLGLKPGRFFVVSCHREENVDVEPNLRKFLRALMKLAEVHKDRVIVSTHPRTRKRLDESKEDLSPLIEFHKPFGFTDYIALEINARAVLSDSGTITEESNILDFPALNIRETHERPEGMEEGAVMMVGLEWGRISEALAILESQRKEGNRSIRIVKDYDVPNVSEKIARIILSYTDYVNQTVWRKNLA